MRVRRAKREAEGEIKNGKNLGALLILEIFVLELSEGFTRQKGLNDVGDGKECDTVQKVFEMDKKVLGVF